MFKHFVDFVHAYESNWGKKQLIFFFAYMKSSLCIVQQQKTSN